MRAIEGVEIVPLDVTDEKSGRRSRGRYRRQGRYPGQHRRAHAGRAVCSTGAARAWRARRSTRAISASCISRRRSARRCARGADGVNSAAAWVNILSVYALANWPAYGAFSASQAACLSLSHCLRAELRPGGVKVAERVHRPARDRMVPDRAAAEGRAARRSRARSCRRSSAGIEDVFVGDVAEDIRQRLAANPEGARTRTGRVSVRRSKTVLVDFAGAVCVRRRARRRSDLHAERRIFPSSCCRPSSANARRSASGRSRVTTSAARRGTGTT